MTTTTTLPKHARNARVRKPNRRPGSVPSRLRHLAQAIVLTFLVSFFLGALFPQLGSAAAHAATVTPAAEAHACHEAVMFERASHVQGVSSQPAWHRAWDASGHADPDLKRAIRHYLDSGHGFAQVIYLCGYGL